jgi:hypothetical protein
MQGLIKLTVTFRANAGVRSGGLRLRSPNRSGAVSFLSFFYHLSVRHESLRYSVALVQPKQTA